MRIKRFSFNTPDETNCLKYWFAKLIKKSCFRQAHKQVCSSCHIIFFTVLHQASLSSPLLQPREASFLTLRKYFWCESMCASCSLLYEKRIIHPKIQFHLFTAHPDRYPGRLLVYVLELECAKSSLLLAKISSAAINMHMDLKSISKFMMQDFFLLFAICANSQTHWNSCAFECF